MRIELSGHQQLFGYTKRPDIVMPGGNLCRTRDSLYCSVWPTAVDFAGRRCTGIAIVVCRKVQRRGVGNGRRPGSSDFRTLHGYLEDAGICHACAGFGRCVGGVFDDFQKEGQKGQLPIYPFLAGGLCIALDDTGGGGMERMRKGSLTIETALLMPIVLLVWMGVVSVCLFVHNRAWLTAAAYESAITGSWDFICKEGDVESRAWEKINILLQNPLYGSSDIHTAVEKRGDTLLVSVEGRHSSYGAIQWRFQIIGSRKLYHPVSFIQNIRRGQTGGG